MSSHIGDGEAKRPACTAHQGDVDMGAWGTQGFPWVFTRQDAEDLGYLAKKQADQVVTDGEDLDALFSHRLESASSSDSEAKRPVLVLALDHNNDVDEDNA